MPAPPSPRSDEPMLEALASHIVRHPIRTVTTIGTTAIWFVSWAGLVIALTVAAAAIYAVSLTAIWIKVSALDRSTTTLTENVSELSTQVGRIESATKPEPDD